MAMAALITPEIAQTHFKHNPMDKTPMSSESLSICTEGLGFESFDDVEELKKEGNLNEELKLKKVVDTRIKEVKKFKNTGLDLPPPISSIGTSGKPWVCLKSFKENGRFILKEVKIPTHEFLYACREDGRLKLRFVQSDNY